MTTTATISKPRKTVVSMATGLAWGILPNVSIQEKLDGVFTVKPWRGNILAGETVQGVFTAFDILATESHGDCTGWPLRDRLAALNRLYGQLRGDGIERVLMAHTFDHGHGGRFLERILAAGGEGVVVKSLDATWHEAMIACKRCETFYCRVMKLAGDSQSVEIARQLPGGDFQPCGRVSLFGGKVEKVRVGSMLKVEAFGVTERGMLREPRLCKDEAISWLVKYGEYPLTASRGGFVGFLT